MMSTTDIVLPENGSGSPSTRGGVPSEAKEIVTTAPTPESNRGWEKVRQKVLSVVGASLNFHTLRDMYGEIVLDPARLKFVSTIAGSCIAHSLCQL